MRNYALIVIALSLSLGGCQASKPVTAGAQVALIRAAMIEAGRSKEGPTDAARAVAAVEAYRGAGSQPADGGG